MEQNVLGHTLPAAAACKDAVIDIGQDEAVLILIKHCRDMKQQETCLRVITLLLLLSCAALCIFTLRDDLRRHESSGSTGQWSTAQQSPAYTKHERVCPADNPPTKERMHIHLNSVPSDNQSDGQYIKWDPIFVEKYNKEQRAIVIPETGFYFVYVRITLSCQNENEDFQRLHVQLHNLNEGYNKTVHLMEARDGLACKSGGSRTVFVGQLFDLLQGDHVSVWIKEGYKLITKSSFGAYLT